MNLPIVLAPEAEADLDEAAIWHEQQLVGLGVDLVREVRVTLVRISGQPELYEELRRGVRRAPVGRFSYGVFYRVRDGQLQVIGVLHDRRSPRIWQRRAGGS